MTKISQLSDIGGSLAAGDEFVIRDVSDISTPNKKVTASGFIDYVIAQGVGSGFTQIAAGVGPLARVLASSSGTTGTLTFSTTADGSASPTERLRITSTGLVGIGTSSPATTLDVNGDVTITDKIIHGGDTNTAIRFPAADTVSVETNSTERARIDSSGRLLVGTSSARSNFLGVAYSSLLQVERAGDSSRRLCASFTYGNSDGGGPFVSLAKHRGAVGGTTVVQSGDSLGTIAFDGADGTQLLSGAYIQAAVDGTPGANDMPGRLVFSTTADGSASPTERLRITSAGLVGIGTTSPSNQLQLSTDSAGKPSTNTWTIVSDERIKEDIELADLDLCYQAVKDIPLKRFKWKDEVYTDEQVRDRHKLGWIAQDVEAVYPKAVGTHAFKYNQIFEEITIPAIEEELDEEGNMLIPAQPGRIEQGNLISEDVIEDCRDLNSDQLYAAMYGAIQKLIGKVETLETEIAVLKSA